MSEPVAPESAPEPEGAAPPETIAARYDLMQRAGGVLVPVITALMAFVIGGIILALSGYNPFTTYWEIAQGAGLNWFGHLTTDTANTSAYNFAQTLNYTTTLILTGLAVAFAFRCGMFNIGGQGQYLVGLIVANWIGVSMAGLSGPAHVALAVVLAMLAGAIWAGIAGFLKATTGAHEVISTIMLNWIAIYIGAYVFGQGGPLQGSQPSAPISAPIVPSGVIKFFWGDQTLGGVNVGFFVALASLVVFWAILNRTTLGFEVRAVGYNPDAAAYGGISVRKNYIRAMAISGGFAGLAGGIEMLGTYQLDRVRHARRLQLVDRLPGDRGCAARPQHRARHGYRGVLVRRPSLRDHARAQHERDPGPADRELDADHPGPDRPLRRRRRPDPLSVERAPEAAAADSPRTTGAGAVGMTTTAAYGRLRTSRLTEPRSIAIYGIALGVLACWLALPPFTTRNFVWPVLLGLLAALCGVAALSRGVRKLGWGAVVAGAFGAGLGVLALQSGTAT